MSGPLEFLRPIETAQIFRKGQINLSLEAGPEALQVAIEGEESAEVERLKGVVATHLDRFAFREAPLKFDWSGPEGS